MGNTHTHVHICVLSNSYTSVIKQYYGPALVGCPNLLLHPNPWRVLGSWLSSKGSSYHNHDNTSSPTVPLGTLEICLCLILHTPVLGCLQPRSARESPTLIEVISGDFFFKFSMLEYWDNPEVPVKISNIVFSSPLEINACSLHVNPWGGWVQAAPYFLCYVQY